jgi:hypothetical protein
MSFDPIRRVARCARWWRLEFDRPVGSDERAPPSNAARTAQPTFAHIKARAANAFYDPPAQVPSRTGMLLRSELPADVT